MTITFCYFSPPKLRNELIYGLIGPSNRLRSASMTFASKSEGQLEKGCHVYPQKKSLLLPATKTKVFSNEKALN